MEEREQIGKITLDYSKYSGQDLYCDGAVEDELLELVKTLSPAEYTKAIEEKKSWPVLYHLSPLRENIVDWIPMEKTAKVLEVGSGCGAVTGALARKAGSVTCVDLSRKRSLINAHRHSECDNVTIHVGNFKDIEPGLPKDYDYICLIGVFEYGQGYIGGDAPYEDFLKILLKHLKKKSGRLIIAIENKYGLKYFAGCREDHLGGYFSGIENYVEGGGVRTFGKRGLEKIFQSAGVKESHFYYPYPDYKFMTTLYSEAYQPSKGDLVNNLRNFDSDRMLLFDEKNAFDGICEEELFPVFSNSYLAVLGGDFDVKFVKYSNDRAPEYAVRTEIHRTARGRKTVRKYPMTAEAFEHVRQMAVAYENLKERYRDGRLFINPCKLIEEDEGFYAAFPFEEGVPLSELMDGCLARNDLEKFHQYFQDYVDRIGYHSEYSVADFDLIFANILVNEDNWTLIDYEWTFGKTIDTKELAFRAIYCYLLENEERERLDLGRVLDELGITEADAKRYREQERDFQRFVTGNRMSMAQLRERLGGEILEPVKWIHKFKSTENILRVQLYEDCGEGFSEENSRFLPDAYLDEQQVEFTVPVEGAVKRLRIDPALCPCVCKIRELTLNGEPISFGRPAASGRRRVMETNGSVMKPARKGDTCPSVVFDTDDPNICLHLGERQPGEETVLTVKMEVVRLPMAMAEDMSAAMKRPFRRGNRN